jgi:amidase
VHSLEEVIRFNDDNRSQVMPFFGQERMIAAQAKGPLSAKKYRQALVLNRRLTRREGIDAALRKHRLDAIVCVSGGPAWTIDLANGDPRSWEMESTSPPAVAGYLTSPYPPASSMACPSAFRSSPGPGASLPCCGWPLPSSKLRMFANRRAS